MKKILSLIFAFILAFAMMLPAFAADHEIGLGVPWIVGNTDGSEESVIFTPEEDGFYIFSYEIRTGSRYDVYCEPDFSYSDVTVYPNYEYPDKFEYVFVGEKGVPVTVDFLSSFQERYRVSVEFNKLSCENTLGNGENSIEIESEGSFFSFIAEEEGYYNFKSVSDYDPMIEIIGMDGLDVTNDDNGFEDDFNFDLTVFLEAGEEYLVYIYDCGIETKCDVTVTFGEKEKIQEINVFTWGYDPDEIILTKNSEEWFYIIVAPTGAIPTSDIQVTSSDESVITIDNIDLESNEIGISTHKSGKAVITVTADGITKEINIRVFSGFQLFFYNLWADIEYFFMNIFSVISSIF